AEAYFHVRLDCTVELLAPERRALLAAPHGARLFAACHPVLGTDGADFTLELDLAAAHRSESYGRCVTAQAVRATAAFSGTVGFVTSFTTSADTAVSARASSEHLRIEVERSNGARAEVVYALDREPIVLGDLRFRGTAL